MNQKIVKKRRKKGPLDEYAGKWVAWIAGTGEVLAVGDSLSDIAGYVMRDRDKEGDFDPMTTPTAMKVPEKSKEPIYI